MKKFKKNLSKTIFASFFVFQFVVTTSVMPLVANAEDIVSDSDVKSSETKVSEEVEIKDESVKDESVISDSDKEVIESDVIDSEASIVEEDSSEEVVVEEPATSENTEAPIVKETSGGDASKDIKKPEDDKKVPAVVRVCKVLLDENGHQVNGDEFPGAVFSLDVSLQGVTKTATLKADQYFENRFIFTGGNAFDAMCDEVSFSFDPSLEGPTVFANYGEEGTSGEYTWEKKYNDGDVSGDAGLYDGSNPRFWSYMDEAGLNDRTDGNVVLAGNTATGFKGQILLVNKFTGYVNPNDNGLGSITVCKVIAKRVNGAPVVASATEVPGYTFTVPWIGAPSTPGTENFNVQPMLSPDATFATNAFVTDRQIMSGSNGNDAMCQKFTNLTRGSYFYGQETISGGDDSVTWTTKYSDQVLVPVNGFEDVDTYRDNIFATGLDLNADPRGSIDANGNTFNTNADGHIVLNRSNAGRHRTLVVVNIFESKVKPPKYCEATRNLIVNGSFETPEVSNAGWDIYENGTVNLGWTVAWNGINPNVSPKLEIQENVSGWQAYDGDQYAELDSDQNGHVGSLNGEPASTTISQVIDTVPGQFYKVTYQFAARPGTPESDNRLGFYVDGVLYDDVSDSGLGLTQPYWQTRILAFYASSTQTTISFSDLGNPNSLGTLLDGVEVVCVDDSNPDNIPPKITVIPDSVCLPMTADSYDVLFGVSAEDAEDGDISHLVIVTSSNIVLGAEGAYVVEYSVTDSDGATVYAMRNIFVKEDCGGNGGDEDPTITLPDVCYDVNTTNFDFLEGVVATDSQGNVITLSLDLNVIGEELVDFTQLGQTFSVEYTFTDPYTREVVTVTRTMTIEDCDDNGGGGNHAPVITGENACIETSVTSLTEEQIKALVSTSDSDGDTVTLTYVVNPDPIVFGTEGTYTITYTANDGTTTTTLDITLEIKNDCDDGGTGGGDDDLVINISNACVVRGTEDFDLLSGVSATYLGDAVTLVEGDNVTITGTVDFNEDGEYVLTYEFNIFGEEETATRTIEIKSRCSSGGGGGGGSSSSSGSSGGSSNGEVLGASTCVAFTTYNRLGNSGGEIKALQTFLNEYMNAGLTVDGVYGRSTVQAVHDFQAYHWSEVIDPWTPPLSPNTTGWEYKTTRMTINAIINCPEAPVYLEDPGVMYQVTEVKDMKPFSTEQMEMIYNLLAEAQSGQVLGATDSNVNNVNILDIFDPNYDLMYGK